VIFVDAPYEQRLQRVQASRGWGADELDRREESQLPLDEKRARADYVVENHGDLSTLADQVHSVLHEILRSHAEPGSA
jgi:dephospho-CoA kinase